MSTPALTQRTDGAKKKCLLNFTAENQRPSPKVRLGDDGAILAP